MKHQKPGRPARVIGIMRFSVLTARNLGNWKVSRGQTVEAAQSLLFDPARLELRFRLLEEMPLRSFDHQSTDDFQLVILTSSLMPKLYLDRLQDLVSKRGYARIRAVSPDSNISVAARSSVAELPAANLVVTFRIDDDDALHPEFINDLHRHRVPENFQKIVTCDRGIFMQHHTTGFLVQEVVYPKNAFGLAFVSKGRRTIYDTGSHSQIRDQRLVINSRPRAWIRSLHDASDSGTSTRPGNTTALPTSEMRAELPQYAFLRFEAIQPLLGKPEHRQSNVRHLTGMALPVYSGQRRS